MWEVESQTQLAALTGKARFSTLTFDGSDRLVTATTVGTVQSWNLRDQTTNDLLRVDGVTSLAIANGRIAIGTESGDVQVWEPGGTQPQYSTRAHPAAVSSLSFSPDSLLLASTGVWRSGRRSVGRSGVCATDAASRPRLGGAWVAWHQDGQFLVSGSTDGTFRIWSAKQARVNLELRGPCRRYEASGSTRLAGCSRCLWTESYGKRVPPRSEPTRVASFDAQPENAQYANAYR